MASNCVSVQPLETELGRKRRIDQSNCNKDFSCIEGFCPSFVTVHGGKLRKADRSAADPSALFADLPLPAIPALDGAYNILVTGIGGTGVITIGALLGMAAHVDGKACSTLDFTGLSQKNGAVMSHVRIAPSADDLANVRIGPGSANLILGCDIVVATSVPALSRAERGVTRAVVNADLLPTASFVIDPDIDFEAGAMRDALNEAVSATDLDILDATGLATALMGDSIATNSFMLGFAFQRGAIPLSLEAIMKAIELNGAAIEMNKLAFSWGRLAAHDLQRVVSAARFKNSGAAPVKRTLDESIAFRAKFLTDYQDEAYSKRYLSEVERVRAAEAKASPGSHDLTEAFAKGLFKLMAYKDEYEVARLYSDGEFGKALKEQFDGDPNVKVSLAPPLLATARQGDRAFAQARVRRLDFPRLRSAGPVQVPARHRVRSVRLHGRAADGAGVAGRILRDDLPPSRSGEAAGLAAAGGAGKIGGTGARLRPHQGSQCREVPRRMRAAGSHDRPAGGAGGRIGVRFTRPVEFSTAGIALRQPFELANGWNCPAGFLH